MSREEETSGEDVGSLAEETMRLLGAVLGPAAEAGGAGFDPQTWAGLSDRAARAAHELNDHIATGGEECRYCPVCRAIQVVRGTSPEVKDQLNEQMFETGQEAGEVQNSRGWRTRVQTGKNLHPDDGIKPEEGQWIVDEQEEPVELADPEWHSHDEPGDE